MLDLRLFTKQTYDITMMDGAVLHIHKPSEAMVIEMMKLRHINSDTEPQVITEASNRATFIILNHNEEGVVVSEEEVRTLPLMVKSAILDGYTEFTNTIASDPTSSSRTTRGTGAAKTRTTNRK